MDLQVLQSGKQKIKRSVLTDPNDRLDLDQFQEIPENSQLYLLNAGGNLKKLTDREAKSLFRGNFQTLEQQISGIVSGVYQKQTAEIISGVSQRTSSVLQLNNYVTYQNDFDTESHLPSNPKIGSAYGVNGDLYIFSNEYKYLKLISKDNIQKLLSSDYCKKGYVIQKQNQISTYLINQKISADINIQNLNNFALTSFLTFEEAQADKIYLCGQISANQKQYEQSISGWEQRYKQLSSDYQIYFNRLKTLTGQIQALCGIITGLIQ